MLEHDLATVLNTIVAVISAITAGIYTWSCFKTKPCTWPLFGLTVLLWACSLSMIARFILTVDGEVDVDNITIIIVPVIIAGYALFLVGTFRAGPLFCKVKL